MDLQGVFFNCSVLKGPRTLLQAFAIEKHAQIAPKSHKSELPTTKVGPPNPVPHDLLNPLSLHF